VNSLNKKTNDELARAVFVFLDKSKDWVITKKEFTKSKLSKLIEAPAQKPKKKKK
jgi:hypothetical protein